jgi:hypothetical protein
MLTETTERSRLIPGLNSPCNLLAKGTFIDSAAFDNVESISKLEISREESLGIAHQDYRGLFDDTYTKNL